MVLQVKELKISKEKRAAVGKLSKRLKIFSNFDFICAFKILTVKFKF